MNNKGQVLVLFLVLLPVVLILFSYVVDKCYLLYQENSLSNIGDVVCSYAIDSNKMDDNIRQLALENDSEIKNIKVVRDKEIVKITLEKEIDSIFGRVIGIDNYKIKTVTRCTE